jgi:hypothetical protein
VIVAAVSTSTGLQIGLVVTALGLGFRHGIDWDHIAALTDITGAQEDRRRSLLLATMYALGHALVVFALGVVAIVLSAEIPNWLDDAMSRVVGLTLLTLGVYVFISLARHGRNFRMRSRWMLVFAAARRAALWINIRRARTPAVLEITHEHPHTHDDLHDHEHSHDEIHHPDHAHDLLITNGSSSQPSTTTLATTHHHHLHRHRGTMPDDPFPTYGRPTAFAIGMLHGIGAETPTQILVFLAAARAGGAAIGITLLVCFIAGLLASNTVVALTAAFGFLGASRHFPLYVTVSVVAAAFSLVVGTLFLIGQTPILPALTGG